MRLIVLLALVLAGCGGSSKGDPEKAEFRESLQGAWSSGCLQTGDGSSQYNSGRRNVQFTGSTYLQDFTLWESTDCTGAPALASSSDGAYDLLDEMIASSGVEGREIDFYFSDGSGPNEDIVTVANFGGVLYLGDPLSGNPRPSDFDFNIPLYRVN